MTPGSATSPRVENTLIGRQWELAELVAGLEDARQGRGRLFLVTGDAGIGKTRLVEGLAEVAEPTDVPVRWGRCWEGGGAPPYWPWTQVLREDLAEVDPATLGPSAPYLAQLVPELCERTPGLAPRAAADIPSVRGALFDAVLDVLRHRHRRAESALVVVLEDLHAADDASLRLLQFIAREISAAPLLVIGTYRDPEVRSSPVLHQRMSALARQGRRIVLGGLHEDGVATLLERVSGTNRLAELARDVLHLTDGNPLFVQEVARLLMAERRRAHDHDLVGGMRVPEEVHALIRRRLEPVNPDVRAALTFAAVLGRDFDLPVLRQLSAVDDDELLDLLDQAAALDVVEDAGLGRWRFSHALLREALYDEIRPSQRVTLHRQAAEFLEALDDGGDGDVRTAQLAHHFFEAARGGDGSRAVDYCTRAAAQAMARLAFEDAAVLYGRALEALALCPPADDHRRYELLMGLAQAQQQGGDLPLARETYQRAAKCARTLAAPELLAQAAIGYTGFVESSPDDSRASLLEEALAALPTGDHPLRARMLALLGHRVQQRRFATSEARKQNWERGSALAAEGVAMARRIGDPATLRRVLFDWHFGNSFDNPEKRLEVADELVQLALDAADREGLVLARQWRAADLFILGDIDAMATELSTARAEADDLRMPFLLWGVAMEQTGLALLRGQLDEADRLIHEALAFGERAEFHDVEGVYMHQLAHLRRHQARFGEQEELLRRLIEREPRRSPRCYAAEIGFGHAYSGRLDEARAFLDGLRAGNTDERSKYGFCCAINVAELAWLLEDRDGAERAYETLLPRAGRHFAVGVANYTLGSVDRYLGQLAALMGRYDDAEAHFEAAHRVHARLGTRLWDAYCRADHARMLMKRCAPGDRARAEDLIETARRAFREMGMGFYEERAAALLETAEPPAAQPTTSGASVDRARLSQEGEYWAFDYGGAVVRLKDSKGVRYLARLLRNPGQEQHALDLMTNETDGAARAAGAGDAGAVLDDRAKAAYRRRMEDLRDEIEEATAYNDLGRVARAQEEMDVLIAEVKAAVGMGGRDRKAASDTERARQSVTRAVKGTVERLAEANPALGDHLRSTIRTGVYSAYVPDPRAPIVWEG